MSKAPKSQQLLIHPMRQVLSGNHLLIRGRKLSTNGAKFLGKIKELTKSAGRSHLDIMIRKLKNRMTSWRLATQATNRIKARRHGNLAVNQTRESRAVERKQLRTSIPHPVMKKYRLHFTMLHFFLSAKSAGLFASSAKKMQQL